MSEPLPCLERLGGVVTVLVVVTVMMTGTMMICHLSNANYMLGIVPTK